jgi:prepilin-type N-terminal cleavage/methylation domain-containing protein
MKRQFLRGKSGFTLFELMIVISIIGLFTMYMIRFDFNPRTNSEKVELMAVSLASQLRTEIQNISIGKMPIYDGRTAKQTEITIWPAGMTTRYLSGTTVIATNTFTPPYFEGDTKYVIQSVIWTGSVWQEFTGQAQLILEPTRMTFTGAPNINNNYLLDITVRYVNSTRKIIIDRRTGKISEKKY